MLHKLACGKTDSLKGRDLKSAKKILNDFQDLDSSSWISIHGTKYIPHECILHVKYENDTPVFGKLRGTWLADYHIVLFRVSILETVNFNEHFNAYHAQG